MDDSSGEHIADHAQEVDARGPQSPFGHDEQTHLLPTRWWFTSSAFPMLAGTFGPVASAFSICALGRPWRQSYDPATTTIDNATFVADPVWLTVINAVQLVIALAANVAMLLNMARRLRFSIAQPVTIVGWYLSSLVLIALLATAARPLEPVSSPPGATPQVNQVFSQAFYYGIYAALLYLTCAILMTLTMIGALAGKYAKDFELTDSQRTLMIQTILFLIYLLGGAAVFSSLEQWAYLDALYWADCTLFTIGLGDFYPTTPAAQGLLIPFALFGIISLGLVIGSIRSLMLERGKKRLHARIMEKSRRRLLKRMAAKGKDGILMPIREGEEYGGREQDANGTIRHEWGLSTSTAVAAAPGSVTTAAVATNAATGLSELARREQEFELMRRVQRKAARRRQWMALAMSTSTWLILWLVGARIFQSCEAKYQGWTYLQAVTFSFICLTTIGYGNLTPVSNGGKAFFVFWTLLALPTTTVLISHAGDTFIKGLKDGSNLLGNVTILPGEKSRKESWQRLLHLPLERLRGRNEEGEMERDQDERDHGVDDDDDDDDEGEPRELPPGILGGSQLVNYHEMEVDEREKGSCSENQEREAGIGNATTLRENGEMRRLRPKATGVGIGADAAHYRRSPMSALPKIPTDKAAYRVLLIDEMRNVARDLRSTPPRRYSYREWVYYLRLVGEDESSARTHERAQTKPQRLHRHPAASARVDKMAEKSKKERGTEGAGGGGKKERDGSGVKDDARDRRGGRTDDDNDFVHSWSWVGSRSPLLETREEAEWILARLARKLSEELRAERDATEARKSKAGRWRLDRISEMTQAQNAEQEKEPGGGGRG